jgi:hypothetical protein
MQNGQMRAKVAPTMSRDISCLLVSTVGIRNFLWQLLQVTIFCCVISKRLHNISEYSFDPEGIIKGTSASEYQLWVNPEKSLFL